MSVPLPTPEGPVMTITRATASPASRVSAAAHEGDELAPLALGQPTQCLAGRDPALGQDLVDLHAAVLRHRQKEVEDLGGLEIIWWLEQQLMDRLAPGLQIALELRPAAANVVGPLQGFHALHQRALRGGKRLRERFTDRRHGRRLYILGGG